MALDNPSRPLYIEALNKSSDEIFNRGKNYLKANTNITNFEPGSIAKSLVRLYSNDISNVYSNLTRNSENYFLSTTRGEFLDELAKLVGLTRDRNESDQNFKRRIFDNPKLQAKANKKAIKKACRDVPGVNKVEMNQYTRGVGTFDVYIITDNPKPSQSKINEVQEKIDEVQGYGINGKAVFPITVVLDLELQYIFYSNTNQSDRQQIRDAAREKLKKYINNKGLGSELIINQLIDLLMDVDKKGDKIKNVKFNKMFIDGTRVMIDNKEFKQDERLVPGNITIN